MPANTALKEIIQSQGRFAVVGLPCHIHGIRKAEKYNQELREKIVLHVGIACSSSRTFKATEKLLESLGILPEEVKKLDYRGKGWPGSMTIQLKDGIEKSIPLAEYYRRFGPFATTRCTLCSDALCELADVSCGDAWLPDVVKNDQVGTSFVISRTDSVEELLKTAVSQGKLELCDLGVDKVLESQGNVRFKKKNLAARILLCKLAGKRVPIHRQRLMKPALSDYVSAVKFYLVRFILSRNLSMLKLLYPIHNIRSTKSPKETQAERQYVAST